MQIVLSIEEYQALKLGTKKRLEDILGDAQHALLAAMSAAPNRLDPREERHALAVAASKAVWSALRKSLEIEPVKDPGASNP